MRNRSDARARRRRASSRRVCKPLTPRAVPLEIAVQPESGEAPFLEVIARAQHRIRVMVYQLGPGSVFDALAKKVAAGVEVRAILDESPLSHNAERVALLRKSGIEVRPGNPQFEYTHAKVIIADGEAAVISTGNFVGDQFKGTRNFAAINRDPEDVAVLTEVFDADWDLRPTDQRCARLVISPDNTRNRVLALLGGATRTIDLESMELADIEVRTILASRHAAGVRVRVVLADPSWVKANDLAADYLAERGIRARYLVSPSVHAKAVVVDGSVAFLGSVNLSYTSLNRNREVGVVVDEPRNVAKIAATLARDYKAAVPFSRAPRLGM
ncbi:MAG: phospholipase D-like domain-containing protein [Minicystis sp.]